MASIQPITKPPKFVAMTSLVIKATIAFHIYRPSSELAATFQVGAAFRAKPRLLWAAGFSRHLAPPEEYEGKVSARATRGISPSHLTQREVIIIMLLVFFNFISVAVIIGISKLRRENT